MRVLRLSLYAFVGESYWSCKGQFEERTCFNKTTRPECSSDCGGFMIATRKSSVRLAPNPTFDSVMIENICFGHALDASFRKIQVDRFQGIGLVDGTTRIFPGTYQEKCGSYDPRKRFCSLEIQIY